MNKRSGCERPRRPTYDVAEARRRSDHDVKRVRSSWLWLVVVVCSLGMSACSQSERGRHAASPLEVAQLDRDEVSARCERVKNETWPPVTCQSLYDDKAQAMVFRFATDEQVHEYLMALAREIAWPFCLAANQAGRHASVLVTVADRRWRRWDCATPDWSDWHVRREEDAEAHEGLASVFRSLSLGRR